MYITKPQLVAFFSHELPTTKQMFLVLGIWCTHTASLLFFSPPIKHLLVLHIHFNTAAKMYMHNFWFFYYSFVFLYFHRWGISIDLYHDLYSSE